MTRVERIAEALRSADDAMTVQQVCQALEGDVTLLQRYSSTLHHMHRRGVVVRERRWGKSVDGRKEMRLWFYRMAHGDENGRF